MSAQPLTPATDLAARSPMRMPNESAEYRTARTALLAEEIELRRQIERVAEMRRALPPGGVVTGDYQFVGADGPVDFKGLFGTNQTLATYSWMFGPQRERPCPMCTSLLFAWDGEARDIEQNMALAVISRSPVERMQAFAHERGWQHLRFFTDTNGNFSRDYYAIDDQGNDIPGFNVFTRRDGSVRHFWSGEMGFESSDPGQDPRGAPDLMPLWTVIDCTPEGRRPDWYPKLDY
ncbi:MAG TPA: DUF899 family protein [Luteibacter sp.]|jgi:predicted dithiol-disulfide oxidoreductase (DUF899 family)|uniref:DUF899 family protein n=1 Tax=Luteibacter sp. TaxID=1886636 RepID=UPI002F406B99